VNRGALSTTPTGCNDDIHARHAGMQRRHHLHHTMRRDDDESVPRLPPCSTTPCPRPRKAR
jgi:hypothetical protein